MNFEPGQIYHLYNRTFNHTLAFPKAANYRFFIKNLRRLRPYCDLLSYCITPDNFEIMLHVPPDSPGLLMTRRGQMQILSRRIGTLLSSYTQAYNKQKGRRGSLFQPKTKSNHLGANARECMRRIHSKPVNLGLAFRTSDWEFSSVQEYEGMREALCNIPLARRFRLL